MYDRSLVLQGAGRGVRGEDGTLTRTAPCPPSIFSHPFRSADNGFAGGGGDGPEHAWVEVLVEGVKGVPVSEAREAPGQKPGSLGKFGAAVEVGGEAEFQGGLPRQLHFGQEQQAPVRLDFQDPEKIQGIADCGVRWGGAGRAGARSRPGDGLARRGWPIRRRRSTSRFGRRSGRRPARPPAGVALRRTR